MIAIFLFVASVIGVGAAYAARYFFSTSQARLEAELKTKKDSLPLNDIAHMKAQATKIVLAKELIAKHLAVSKLFTALSLVTAENVRFLSMDATIPMSTSGNVEIALTGYGKDYTSLAFQSDVLNELNKLNLQNVIKNPIISSPGLNKNGTVTFGLTAQVDPTFLNCSKTVSAVAPQDGSSGTNDTNAADTNNASSSENGQ